MISTKSRARPALREPIDEAPEIDSSAATSPSPTYPTRPSRRPSAIAAPAAWAGLPVSAVMGVRQALERGPGQRRPGPVLAGSVAAVTAVVMAAVFGASLDGLVHHPARYGWNWDLLIEAAGGYSTWKAPVMDRLVGGRPGVTAWSQFGFSQVAVDGQEVPVIGLHRELGSVEPGNAAGNWPCSRPWDCAGANCGRPSPGRPARS